MKADIVYFDTNTTEEAEESIVKNFASQLKKVK